MWHLFILKRCMSDHIQGINRIYAIIWDVEKSLRQVLHHIQMQINLFCYVSVQLFILILC